jgi:hypothetical protein
MRSTKEGRRSMRKLPPRMSDELYHEMILPEETWEIRDKAREFAVRVIAPRAYDIAHTEEKRENFFGTCSRPWLRRVFIRFLSLLKTAVRV